VPAQLCCPISMLTRCQSVCVCPGSKAISDLMMWFATYCGQPAPTSQSPRPSEPSTAAAPKPDSADTDAAGQQAVRLDKTRRTDMQARNLHTQLSALSAEAYSRDPETNGMMPPLWRPYRVPSVALCRAVANNLAVPSTVPSPMHFAEVEPEQQ
jgi:hypothetical protein